MTELFISLLRNGQKFLPIKQFSQSLSDAFSSSFLFSSLSLHLSLYLSIYLSQTGFCASFSLYLSLSCALFFLFRLLLLFLLFSLKFALILSRFCFNCLSLSISVPRILCFSFSSLLYHSRPCYLSFSIYFSLSLTISRLYCNKCRSRHLWQSCEQTSFL